MDTPAIAGVLPASMQLLSSSHLTTLWSSYGHIYRIRVRLGSNSTSLILKTVKPPVVRAADESHLRKLVSYRVERYFYSKLASALSSSNPARVAKHYPVASDDSLLLEDLEVEYPVSPGSGLGVQRTRAVLKWLANFHAAFWGVSDEVAALPPPCEVAALPPPCEVASPSEAQGAWAQGGYWYLDTRQDEYACIGRDWKPFLTQFQAAARLLKTDPRGRTLIHGDCKAANILFSSEGATCALYDFQYVGGGLGAQDLVYFLGTSVDGAILRKKGGDEELLGYYHQELMQALNARGVADAKLFTLQVLKEQFEVALVDWMRFMAGWGRWGNAGWVDSNVRSILKKWAETPQES